MYIAEFIRLLKKKQESGDDFNSEGFNGWLVKSFKQKGRVYFVQREESSLLSGRKVVYTCSCPHGYRKMYGGLARNAPTECKHIGLIKS